MNTLQAAAQQALEALEWSWGGEPIGTMERDAIIALKAALEQPEQEPFGYFQYAPQFDAWVQNRDDNTGVAFYTHPPRREWQTLTDAEIVKLADEVSGEEHGVELFALAIEARLKELNA
jgi:hypothetical protein